MKKEVKSRLRRLQLPLPSLTVLRDKEVDEAMNEVFKWLVAIIVAPFVLLIFLIIGVVFVILSPLFLGVLLTYQILWGD